MNTRLKKKKSLNGVATVELAVCLPAIVLLVFASIESCSMIFLDQSLCIAGYEGARVAIQKHTTNEDVIVRCNEILESRGVKEFAIQIDPSDISKASPGDLVSVTVSAPCDANAIMPSWFYAGSRFDEQSTMAKE